MKLKKLAIAAFGLLNMALAQESQPMSLPDPCRDDTDPNCHMLQDLGDPCTDDPSCSGLQEIGKIFSLLDCLDGEGCELEGHNPCRHDPVACKPPFNVTVSEPCRDDTDPDCGLKLSLQEPCRDDPNCQNQTGPVLTESIDPCRDDPNCHNHSMSATPAPARDQPLLMASSNSSDQLQITNQKQYLKGHLIVGAMAMIHTSLPLLVGQLWWKHNFKDDSLNPWYGRAWKAMQAGGVVATGLQSVLFPLTFIKLSILERLGWVGLWLVHGFVFGTWSTVTVLSYFIVAAVKYQSDPDLSVKNLWITILIYLAFQVKSYVLGHIYIKDSIYYLLGEEINKVCDTYKDDMLCKGFGIKYWWNDAWNEDICEEEDNKDCEKYKPLGLEEVANSM